MWDRIQDGLWWDKTLSLVSGCTKVSPGCDHCWAEMETRVHAGKKDEKSQNRYGGLLDESGWIGTVREMWGDLDKINPKQKPTVYTVWNDLFHPAVEFEFQCSTFSAFKHCQQHTFIVCTKRPEVALESIRRIYNIFSCCYGFEENYYLPNVIIMTTVENQEQANVRIPLLLQIPAAKRALSVEPMLGPVNLTNIIWDDPSYTGRGKLSIGFDCRHETHLDTPFHGKKIDWVVCGGESGKGARPVHPDWVRYLRDQCVATGTKFMFKQWGEYTYNAQSATKLITHKQIKWLTPNGEVKEVGNGLMENDDILIHRLGKKTCGRLLDGRTWDEHPV